MPLPIWPLLPKVVEGVQKMETAVEQRKEKRTDLVWPVSVWLPEAGRFFNGHSANISKVGAFVTVPITTPARPGSVVELNFPRTDTLAQEKGQYARIRKGRVVRVDRKCTLDDASIGLGIAFE
jgi:hypothetical protein